MTAKHQCLICLREFRNRNGLSRHIVWLHEVSVEQYYLNYLKGEINNCANCGSKTRFIGIEDGYSMSCGHSCGAIMFRKIIKDDPVKYAQYNKNISKAVSAVWKERDDTGEKREIFKKISETKAKSYALLTTDERKAKFGWLNKLSGDEYNDAVKRIYNASWGNWWKNATHEQKLETWHKQQKSIAKSCDIIVDETNMDEFIDEEGYRLLCKEFNFGC